jgi:hypothetical protein
MSVSTLAQNVGKGLAAGLIGTAAMTVSSTVEARIRGRAASSAPADATAKVLGIAEFESPAAKNRFSNLSHWGYGTSWGVVRALLSSAGLPPRAATVAHTGAVYGNELVMLPVLDVAPPAFLWPRKEVAIDAWHHLVYGVATGVAYDALTRGNGSARASD